MPGTKKTVYAALAANASLATLKGVAGVLTGSSVMLAESAHSVADTVNQIFLRVSISLGDREPDEEHPFGHGKDRFLWAFVAAIFIFVAGSIFSVARGIYGLLAGSGGGDGFVVAYGVLAFALVAEGLSFVRAYRQVRGEGHERNLDVHEVADQTSDPTMKTVLLEDGAALVGIALGFVGVGLRQLTGSEVPDAAAAIVVGLLLAYVAFRIAQDSRMLLLGQGAPPEDVAALERTVSSHPEVKDLLELRTMYLGPRSLLVAARVDFVEDIDADRVEEVSGQLRSEMAEAVPEASEIFLDATRRGAFSTSRTRSVARTGSRRS